MPTYDYKCNDCGHIFEIFHNITEIPDITCGKCNSNNIERKISLGSGFILKGSGFYTTDYKRKEEKTLECSKTSGCQANCPINNN